MDIEELIWALLDNQISKPDFQRLEAILHEDESARRLYVQCVQMHADIRRWFNEQDAAPPPASGAPVESAFPSASNLGEATV